MSKAKVFRDDFSTQLVNTNNEISNLQNQIKGLEVKREQLKGAVYALDELIKVEEMEETLKVEKQQKKGG